MFGELHDGESGEGGSRQIVNITGSGLSRKIVPARTKGGTRHESSFALHFSTAFDAARDLIIAKLSGSQYKVYCTYESKRRILP